MKASLPAGLSWRWTWILSWLLAPAAAAQDCRLEYHYAATPTSQSQQEASVARGQTMSINRSDMLYVVNKLPRELEVQVTIPIGGSRWVALEKDQRDPPLLNYIGNVTLQKVKCLHLHESPVAMYTSLMTGTSPGQFAAATAVVEEFNLNATQMMQHLQPHVSATTAARVLRDIFGYSPDQVAGTFRQKGYAVNDTRDALWASSTDDERRQQVPSGVQTEGAILQWLKGPYGLQDAAQSMIGFGGLGATNVAVSVGANGTLVGGDNSSMSPLGKMMRGAEYTPAEAAATIRQLASGPYDANQVAWQMMGGSSSGMNNYYPMSEVAQGIASAFGGNPSQVAQWLMMPFHEQQGYHRVAEALVTFSQSRAQITAWLLQAGLAPATALDAMARSTLSPTLAQIVEGLRVANIDAETTLRTLEAIRAQRSSVWGPSLGSTASIVNAMKIAGYQSTEVAIALKQVHEGGVAQSYSIAFWLKSAEYDARELVDGLRAAYPGESGAQITLRMRNPAVDGYLNSSSGFSLQIPPAFAAEGLRASFGAPNAQVAGWLVAPWKTVEQALGIHGSLSTKGSDIATWLKSSSRPVREIGGSLKEVVTTDRPQLASHLLQANFTPPEAAEAIRYMGWFDFNYAQLSAQPVAEAMRDGGFSYEAIVQGITSQFPQVTQREIAAWVCPSTTSRTLASPTLATRSLDATTCSTR